MTEDKWVKILEKEEEHQKESNRREEEVEEDFRKISLKNLPIFESNIERLNKILKNYNCQFGIPEEISIGPFQSLLDTKFYNTWVVIRADIGKEPIEYYYKGALNLLPKIGMFEKKYTDFDKLIDDFIEAFKKELVRLKED